MRLNAKGQRWVLGAVGLVVVAVVAWGVIRSQSRPTVPSGGAAPSPVTTNPSPFGTGAPTNVAGPVGATPQPWSFDPATNRHFDPNHGHWHDGPPPPPESRAASGTPQPVPGALSTGPAPAPWTYDARNNQHWNPDHAHWHPGPPPPVGSR